MPREIIYQSKFKSDLKKISRSGVCKKEELFYVLEKLANDEPLDINQQDHPLTGNWKNYRECHIKPDLLLIYQKPDDETLWLARLGSHSELF